MEISNNYSTAKVWNTSNKNVSKSSKKNKWKLTDSLKEKIVDLAKKDAQDNVYFEIDISLPPGIGVYSYYGSTSTHYFDICGVSVSPSDDSSISASETIFHLAYTMYHPF